MPLRAGIGRAASRVIGNSHPLLIAGMSTAAAVGVGSALIDRQGPYAPIQDHLFGDSEAIRYSMKAGITTGFSPDRNIYGPGNYYYGRPVGPAHSGIMPSQPMGTGRTTPVPGDVVLGQYNLRHGGR